MIGMSLDLLEPISVTDDGILSNADYDLIAESGPASGQPRDDLAAALIALALLLSEGRISTREFQSRAAILLRDLHWLKARELIETIDPDIRAIIQEGLRQQYYSGRDPLTGTSFGLAWLVRDLIDGRNSLPQLESRLRAFADSDRTIEESIRREIARRQGLTHGMRVLGVADHCPSCPIYAEFPPLPIDQLIMPTEQCECRTNCKCSIIYMTLEEAVRQGGSASGFI